ncbi:fungal-specific transcription factor domain-containing protein [Penicillium canescens]|nr:fungal-specific transcription factor domain-containing protein [Penicillium canescens]
MTEAIAHEPWYATSLLAAQTSSAVNEDYQRIQLPETDQDAVGPRTYNPIPNEEHNEFMFPDMTHVPAEDVELEDFAHVERVPADITEKVLQFANDIQVNSNYPRFIQLRIPPPSVLNSWVQLYFEHFHPVFPILHKSTFVPSRMNPFLVFAVAALGSHFSNINGSFPCLKGMHELIRRYTAYTCEKWSQKSRELWMTQTIILNQLGLMYSGDRRALELAELFQSVPVTLGRRKRLFSNVLPPDKLSSMLLPIDSEWQLWVLDEQRRRAGFAIWLIDLAYDHDFDLSHTVRPEELKNCLPQLESRWDAPNGQSWASFASGNAKYPTLCQVAASSSWRASWAQTGTLGKQAILQYLAYVVDARWQSAGIPGFSADDRRTAARTLEELLTQIEDGCDIYSVSELKAAIVHRIMAMTALMNFHAPVSNLLSVAFKVIYGKLQKGFWEGMADQWAEFPNQGRTGVLFAARILKTVGSSRCTHFSTPVSLLRAVLLLWLYSTISDRLRRLFPAQLPIPSVVLDLKALDSVELRNWIENGSSCVKLPGCGNIMTIKGRSKMLSESVSVMKSLKAWGINSMYAQLLTRLQETDSPQE